jgi:hypothetical protein
MRLHIPTGAVAAESWADIVFASCSVFAYFFAGCACCCWWWSLSLLGLYWDCTAKLCAVFFQSDTSLGLFSVCAPFARFVVLLLVVVFCHFAGIVLGVSLCCVLYFP